ncbi:MAG: ABC transporter ATP-binding protein [Vicinamibacterales bacterium]|nr:ABC transporter ATP-binding protein [Vicinamibacterales bacterium]
MIPAHASGSVSGVIDEASPLLRADAVSFSYGSHAVLHDVDVTVPAGGLVGVLGPNGSGKTTLLKLLAGLLTPGAGRVTLDGRDTAGLDRVTIARRLAVVPQETELAFDYSVLEIVLMGRYPHLHAFELEGPADLDIARRMLAATGTADLEQRSFRTLSGGEKQRVILASALAQFESRTTTDDDPGASRVLLLDEPTSSLDLAFQLETAALLGRLNRDHGMTVIVCTHDLNFAAGLCRDLVLLRDRRILAAGPTDAVLTPDTIAAVYDVDADVHRHAVSRQLTVVPLARR